MPCWNHPVAFVFSAEFGVEPGERLQNLHVGILRSDPALAAPPSPEPADDPPDPEPAAPAAPAAPRFAPPGPRLAPTPEEVVAPGASPAVPAPPPTLSGPVHDAPAIGAVPGHHVADAAWAPPPASAGRRVPWPVRAVLVALPVLGFGLVTWSLVAYYAGRRRSRPLALMAAGYLALTVVFLVGATSGDPDQSGWQDGPIFLALLTTMFGGAVHLAVLTADPPWSPHQGGVPVLNVQLIERRVRREQARSLAAHHPPIARRLGIGRPDLPRTFDDGGLVDVNSAPEHVLASLPGLDPYHAKLIVLARTAHGPFVAVDDLATGEILPYQAVYALRDMLIAVPPGPGPEPDTAEPSAESAPGA